MKKFYLLTLCLCMGMSIFSQTIVISGQCISGNITATAAGTEAGKPYYIGSGTILGFPNVELGIYWMAAPENVWVISFDGQPFYTNPCNTPIPPGTSPNICQWEFLAGNPACPGPPLSVTGAVILPVTLTDLTATAVNNAVLIQWNTQQELNNSGFSIQRSANGQQWADIGFVAGAVNSSVPLSYSFRDNAPLSGINFYRLVQKDLDGRTSTSDVVTASINSNRSFTISDNPGNGIYKLNMLTGTELLEIQVTDAYGRLVLSHTTRAGNQVIDISRNAPGVYWLKVKKGREQSSLQLIKL